MMTLGDGRYYGPGGPGVAPLHRPRRPPQIPTQPPPAEPRKPQREQSGGAPAAGANSFTEAQAKSALKWLHQGFRSGAKTKTEWEGEGLQSRNICRRWEFTTKAMSRPNNPRP